MRANRAFATARLGDWEAATAEFQASIATLQRLQEFLILGGTLTLYLICQVELGAPEELAMVQAQLEGMIAASPMPNFWSALPAAILAWALLRQGQHAEAEQVARRTAELMLQMGRIGRPYVVAALVRSLLAQGHIEEARATAEEGLTELAVLGGRCLMYMKLLLAAAKARLAASDLEGARQVAIEADALLAQRAAKLEDDTARARFLGLKDHARVRALAG